MLHSGVIYQMICRQMTRGLVMAEYEGYTFLKPVTRLPDST